jgi:NADH-quinone oxidoreductase subunit M
MFFFLLFLPLIGALLLAGRRSLAGNSAGRFAMVWTLLTLLFVSGFGVGAPEAVVPWLGEEGMILHFRMDGMALVFVVLTSLVTVFSVAASLLGETRDRSYFALILLLEFALFGVFTARHFIPWFLFWEMTLIPSYLLIRLWGGRDSNRASLRFFIMTLGGSVFMLVGFLALQVATGTMDFDALGSMAAANQLAPSLLRVFGFTGANGQALLTGVAFFVLFGLAVKLPIVPFHAWLPAAYAEAPTPVTILLTGVLSKMGLYGLIRVFLPVFPEVSASIAPLLGLLALLTVLIGALAAMAQTDLKRMLAYSSINHLGYCALAVAAVAGGATDRDAVSAALSGCVLQAFNHGIIASSLFFGVMVLEHRSGGLRGLNDFGGLRARMPVFCGVFGIATFASIGLPGLSGFVGEFLMFSGVFAIRPIFAAVSLLGLLLTAVFLLRMIRVVFLGPLRPSFEAVRDLGFTERLVSAAAVMLIGFLGVFPGVLLHFSNPEMIELLDLLSPMP